MLRSRDELRALDYHDVLLRRADVDLLAPGRWLNDQIIAFFFEFLLREVHPELASSVALITPAMCFLLLNSDPSEAAIVFESLKLAEKQLVVLPVNDNPDVQAAAGGSHWSCLVFHRPSNSFRHYDSCKLHNSEVARELAGAATPLVRSRQPAATAALPGTSSSSHTVAGSFPEFVEVVSAPQQENSSDCGIYVLAVTQALCATLSRGGLEAAAGHELEQLEKTVLAAVMPAAVLDMRQQLLHTIGQLAAVKQKA